MKDDKMKIEQRLQNMKKFYIKAICETKHLQQPQSKKTVIKKKTA